MNLIKRYTHWLHTQWPAGKPEKLPLVHEGGATNVPGLYITGDLTGIPLLKFSADTGARAVREIMQDPEFRTGQGAGDAPAHANPEAEAGDEDEAEDEDVNPLDLAIIGGGVSGFSAALEARKQGLRFTLFEATEPFSTIVNFPKAKPIYTYPTEMTPTGELQFHEKSEVKEGLLEDLQEQTLKAGVEPVQARVDRVKRTDGAFEIVLAGDSKREGDDGGAAGEVGPLTARRVIVAIGRSGNFRKLNVPGEEKDKVYNRLHDPADFCDKNCLVVGGGDSALETAIALAQCGASVTLSYRKPEFSRPKPENVERLQALVADPNADIDDVETVEGDRVTTPSGGYITSKSDGSRRKLHRGSIRLLMSSQIKRIDDDTVEIVDENKQALTLDNDVVFTMIGREPPLEFFRKSGVRIRGEWTTRSAASLAAFLAFAIFLYHWKKPGAHIVDWPPFHWIASIGVWWRDQGWFPYNVSSWWASLGEAFNTPANLLGTMKISLGEPGFYYTLAYCLCVVLFGIDRIRRRKTPYVKVQTLTLMAIQCVPLFILPYVFLPWAGNNGWFDAGWMKSVADSLFPQVNYGHGREYWRAFGLILAWPLFVFNLFTAQPLWGWIILSVLQTFVIIPLIIWRWGKGAYCGWICSCGALAETMGDRHRHKMPHGPFWNRFNMVGQVFLVFALVLMLFRSLGWAMGPQSWPSRTYDFLFTGMPVLNYAWFVDLLWAGILGVGLYFWFSGRVWCRFACPLAALMHVYARFSQFRILADKKKCISCNVCTSVCHQGIDVMSFANKGLGMEDPECVRCSACVQSCPTGVLQFGRVNRRGETIAVDRLGASPVIMREQKPTKLTVNGASV